MTAAAAEIAVIAVGGVLTLVAIAWMLLNRQHPERSGARRAADPLRRGLSPGEAAAGAESQGVAAPGAIGPRAPATPDTRSPLAE